MKSASEEGVHGNPPYRFELRGRIAIAGFRTLGDFAQAIGTDSAKISRIIRGWEWPNEKLRVAMAEKLGTSMDDLLRIL